MSNKNKGKVLAIQLGMEEQAGEQPHQAVHRFHNGVLGGKLHAAAAALAPLGQPAEDGDQFIPLQFMAAGHAVGRGFYELLFPGDAVDQHIQEAAHAGAQEQKHHKNQIVHVHASLYRYWS